MTGDERFPKSARLLVRKDFERVYAHGKVVSDHLLIVRAIPSLYESSRLGLAVTRRIGNAVTRNKWKRLIREAFRLSRHDWPQSLDIIVTPRAGAAADFAAVRRSLNKLIVRIQKRV